MRMIAEHFNVMLRIFVTQDKWATRCIMFEEQEDMKNFLEGMADALFPDDEVHVTAEVKYETTNGEARYLSDVELFKMKAKFIKDHLEDL